MVTNFYDNVCLRCSSMITKAYSTSFSLGILCFEPKLRDPIYSIYGFVRFADEIVDTFHGYNKVELLERFKIDTFNAIEDQISLNPILHNFQKVVNTYTIDHNLIHLFLKSMEMDLYVNEYTHEKYNDYILGSAEVVGLMCLKVFCAHGKADYNQLKPYAMKLGAAFQKVNFLRDLKNDYETLGRTYFPDLKMDMFSDEEKSNIEKSIEEDFKFAFEGIKRLPSSSRFGVYLAYVYYLHLFKKIKNTPTHQVLERRIRVPNQQKLSLFCTSYLKHRFNLI